MNIIKRDATLDKFFDDIFNVTFKNGFPTFYDIDEGFPFHDIYEDETGDLLLEIAVAGYNKDNINIQVENGYLVIKGNNSNEEEKSKRKYFQKKISAKSFEKVWKIPAKYNDTPNAEFKDGILKIKFQLDEQKKPKLIEIK